MKPPATSAAQFRLVEQWFDDVSSLDPHAREHWFAARRAEHPELCAEVESLLAQRAGESDFLERSASPAVSEAVHRMLLRDPRVQSTIGSFVVESVIAVGGMGTVYRAHDADRPEQPVALKVIHPGTGSEEIQLRFRRESELLASLDHPRIAKFLANGLTAEGEPFYAMEFIDGERITDACDRARMSFDRRLELFCEVCDAVQHAHDNAIVHRDLKPGNILVDDRGRPHLIDFGIAKILSDKNVDPTTAPYPTRLLTPEYASPEQVRGLPATASSDVYSLGVVLYELLTSRTPYVFASYHPSEILAVVADPVITAPSRRIGTGDEFERAAEARATTIARWRRRLAKDLDDIVLCALRREPDRRYASAAHLAADIRRALRGERILARPDTAWYRLSRYCERHRVVVVAAAALALTLVVGIAGTLHQAWRAEEQAELARRQAATSTEILGLMLELFEGDDLGPRPRMSAREFVNRAATRLANYGHLDPSIQAAVYEALARMYDYVAAPEPAIDLYERAIGLRERSVAAGGEDRRELLQSRSKLGLAKVRSGDPVAGRELLTAARLEASATGDAVLGGDIATSLALLAAGTGEPRRAQELFEEALRLRITGRGERHASVASAMNNLATACCRLGEFDRAEALLRSALAIHRECEWHGSVGQDLNNLGLLLVGRERFAEARTALDEALAIRSERLGPEHETVAQTSYALGMLAARQGDLETAADRFRQAAAIQERARPGFWHAADTRSRLGEILLELGRIDEARPLLEASAAALRTALGPDHEHTLEAEARLATLRSREASDR